MAETQITGFDINAFSQNLGNVNAANQFYATVTLPQALQNLFPENDRFVRKIGFSIKAANIPDWTVGEIPVNFRNAKFRIPGDRDQSGTWDITVRSDVDNVARSVFERWSDACTGMVEHDTVDDEQVINLMGQGEIYQLTKNNRITKGWNFAYCWPTTVGAVAYDWSTENGVVEFPVSLVYQSIESNTTRNNVISEQEQLSGTVLF